ncbi:hypothetical protein SAMN02746095_01419 [Acidocella aminolytica 101 = DSM 11237]|nr:hypothetical protein AA11237_0854 [Acidocella aminolytica 101 = DSM 11237]SHE86590.1 hypothetical protein SAMN02746095_01419 [Acidocella aminolytica 101 = DSM 11237]
MCLGFGVLAGCAAPQDGARYSAQGVSYTGKVLAVRAVAGGPATARIMQALGQPNDVPQQGAREIVVQLADGSVKTLVPPPGVAPATLVPGSRVVITETPQMRITAR